MKLLRTSAGIKNTSIYDAGSVEVVSEGHWKLFTP